jgi:hypothetical protein
MRAWQRARASRHRARPAPQRPAARRLVAVAECRRRPAQIAARAGQSVSVLLTIYSRCISGQDHLLNQQIDHVLAPPARPCPWPSVGNRRLRRPCDRRGRRPPCVRGFPARPAHSPQTTAARNERRPTHSSACGQFRQFKCTNRTRLEHRSAARSGPQLAHKPFADGLLNRSLSRRKPVTPSSVTGFDLRKRVAGDGFEPS